MKFTILLKTLIVTISSLLIILATIGWYSNSVQNEIISEMKHEQKDYIIKQLDKVETDKIKTTKEIVKNLSSALRTSLSNALYNMDNKTIRKNIFRFLSNNDASVGVVVFDNMSKSINVVGYKYNENVEFLNTIPQEFKQLESLKCDMVVDGEDIGYLQVYYDTSSIEEEVLETKKQNLAKFEENVQKIDKKVSQQRKKLIIGFLVAGLLFALIIYLIIKKLVSNPLREFQKGLQSFFDYMKDSKKTIKKINIDTNDEFGEMTKSVNESIEVSVTLHQEIQDRNELTIKLNRELEESEYELELLNQSLEIKIKERTKDLEEAKKEVEVIHKHTRDSIEYASLIQGALIPQTNSLAPFFKDYFATWTPKDTVGGDIWLFEQLRNKDECLLFFIDCTGHGVPGAFVTMIVKSIEREIISKLRKRNDLDISPAIIMGYFNKTMKTLLRQEDIDSLSNAGFDGGIIYYNRRTQILKFAGAETSLFYIMPDGEFKTIKGNRYSVGYKKCDSNYKYKETIMEVQEGMKFYCTTDGYLDQNGGEKGFPFGKKRFSNIIKENYKDSMADLQSLFMFEMMEWENKVKNNDRNDDMTIIGFEIGTKSISNSSHLKEIVKYEGLLNQEILTNCLNNIELQVEDINMTGKLSIITIEYCQNIMNYAKSEDINSHDIVPFGYINIDLKDNKYFEILSKNIVSKDDKAKIEPKLLDIQSLDKQGIKKRYRELRKSGHSTHSKGGGIGIYEIAKVCDSIEYEFVAINEDRYYFIMKSIVNKIKVIN
jgi:serine phosphatase RsbU (regulator of sigma subunit)